MIQGDIQKYYTTANHIQILITDAILLVRLFKSIHQCYYLYTQYHRIGFPKTTMHRCSITNLI